MMLGLLYYNRAEYGGLDMAEWDWFQALWCKCRKTHNIFGIKSKKNMFFSTFYGNVWIGVGLSLRDFKV